jgi:hypothetical protein
MRHTVWRSDLIDHALALTRPHDGFVAMLLRCDYDQARTRRHLFDHPFARKVVLTRRIRWLEDSKDSPGFSHAWFVWDWQHVGAPMLAHCHHVAIAVAIKGQETALQSRFGQIATPQISSVKAGQRNRSSSASKLVRRIGLQ